MLLVRDENNIRGSFSLLSLSNCSSFILIALKVSVWQDSSWSDMSTFSGETTTTNLFDGRLLSFPVRATSTAICRNLVDNRDKRFPMPVRQARRFKNETGSWTTRRWLFFFSFHRLRYPKRKKADLVTLYDWTLPTRRLFTPIWARHVYNVGSINDSGIRVNKTARRNGLKLQSANNARGMRFK